MGARNCATNPPPMRPNLWFLVPIVVLVSAAVATWQRDRVPTRAEWQAAADTVRARLAPGDGVTWAPYTQGEGRTAFAGLPMFHTRDLGTADLARYDRVWVLGALGYDAARLPAQHTLLEHTAAGNVSVDLVRVGGPKVVGDLYAHLEDALYTRHSPDGATKLCGFWSGRGWHCELRDPPETTRNCLGQAVGRRLDQKARDPECGLNPWLHVSRDVRLIGDTPRHCIWMHPMAEGAVRLTWNDAPGGDALSIDFGFSDPMVADNYAKQLRVKPATLRVLRAGIELQSIPVPAEKGWHHFETSLPSGPAPLAFELTTTATADAHFCFDPTVRMNTRPGSTP
jgi:hypothetical protein